MSALAGFVIAVAARSGRGALWLCARRHRPGFGWDPNDDLCLRAPYNAAGLGCTGPILLALVLYALASGQALLAFAVFSLTMAALMFSVTLLSGLAGRARQMLRGRLSEPATCPLCQGLGSFTIVPEPSRVRPGG